jgi:transposase
MKTLLAGAHILKLEKIVQQSDAIILLMSSKQATVACPSCQRMTGKVHSRYERTIADLPWESIAVRIRLQVRKFFCLDAECRQHIFCERLLDVAARYAHRTMRLNEVLATIGFALGGRAGARTAQRLGIEAGSDSILRRIRAVATKPHSDLKVRGVGIDDWALKKGQNYGTILVDLEKRRPIDLLQGREAKPLEEWLKEHPEIEIVTRDRAGAYADGSRHGAPQAQQVADRWHILKNSNEAFEKIIKRHRRVIRESVDNITLSPSEMNLSTATEKPPVVAQRRVNTCVAAPRKSEDRSLTLREKYDTTKCKILSGKDSQSFR